MALSDLLLAVVILAVMALAGVVGHLWQRTEAAARPTGPEGPTRPPGPTRRGEIRINQYGELED